MILPARTSRAPIGCGSLPSDAATTPPRSKQTVAGRLPQLGGDAQHSALPAQVEQLEDVLDVQLLEGSLERHGHPAEAAKMCWRSRAERARLRACAAYGPDGSSCTTRSHASTAWSKWRWRASAAPW